MDKKLIWGLVIVVIIGVFGYFYNQKNEEFKLITDDEELAEFMQNMEEGDLEEYLAKKEELYAQDNYGGETPEETLDLYIEALKAGDLELASKYFRLEDQEKEKKELVVLNNEDSSKYINMLEKAYLTEYDSVFKSHELRVLVDEIDALIMRIIKIDQSGLWKLKSL